MRIKWLLACAALALSVVPAYAQKAKSVLQSEINSTFPDNTTGAITPAGVRATLSDFVNSWQQYMSVNKQTGTTYTVLATDYGQVVTFNNSGAIAVTLPNPTGTFLVFNTYIANVGTGTITLSATGATINGLSSVTLAAGQSLQIVSDGSGLNYQTVLGFPTNPVFNTVTINAGTLNSGAALTITGTTPSSGSGQGINFTQNITGSLARPSVFTGTNFQYTDTSDAQVDEFNLNMSLNGTGWRGFKTAVTTNVFVNGSPSLAPTTGNDYNLVSLSPNAQGGAPVNPAYGVSLWGLNPIVQVAAGATGYANLVGAEFDMVVDPTGSVDGVTGINMGLTGNATTLSTAYTIGCSGTCNGWDFGYYWFPNAIKSTGSVLGSAQPTNAKYFLDGNAVTISSGGAYLRTKAAILDNNSNLTIGQNVTRTFPLTIHVGADLNLEVLNAAGAMTIRGINDADAAFVPLTISSSAMTLTGGGTVSVFGTTFGLTGNISHTAWTTNGIRYANVSGTLTDTSSSGTVAAAYTNVFNGNTIAASSATTYTNYIGSYFQNPIAGGGVTFTSSYALGADSAFIQGGTLIDGAVVFNLTATMPSVITAARNAVNFTITSAGSSSQINRAFNIDYAAGYTGSSSSIVGRFANAAAGTAGAVGGAGTNTLSGNIGLNGSATAATTGWNIGNSSNAGNGNLNVGLWGLAQIAKNSATNIGVVGSAANTGTSPVYVGGWFTLGQTTIPTSSAALIVDNAALTDPIARFQSAGADLIVIYDSGGLGVNRTDPGAGNVDVSGIYKVGGTSGLSVTKTVRASGGASDCTLIFSGGILTGGTC